MNHIYFTGYDAKHANDFVFDVPQGYDCYLLLITNTPAKFWIDGKIEECPGHYAILYPPHHKIWYAASMGYYGNDWIRFASDETFVSNFPLSCRPFPVSDPDYCHNLIQLLTWETSQLDGTAREYHYAGSEVIPDTEYEQGNLIISQLLRILFLKLRDDVLNLTAPTHNHELLTLRRQIYNNPQLAWNVPEMAKQLHISAGHLHMLYKQKFGVSCMDDVIEFRLRKARELLTYTDLSIAEIAEQCGYRNVEHFCRQFKKCVGITPGKFKKSSEEASNHP